MTEIGKYKDGEQPHRKFSNTNENIKASGNWKECPVCKKKFKNLGAHMKAHKPVEQKVEPVSEAVEATKEDLFGEIENPAEKPTLTAEDRIKNMFNVKEEEVPEISLKDFLVEQEVTYKQLTKLIEKGKDGTALNVKEELARNLQSGKTKANVLKDQDIVETSDINVCDALVKSHGYTAESRKGANSGKKWILRKIK